MAQFKDNILPKNKQKTHYFNKGKQMYSSSNKLFYHSKKGYFLEFKKKSSIDNFAGTT